MPPAPTARRPWRPPARPRYLRRARRAHRFPEPDLWRALRRGHLRGAAPWGVLAGGGRGRYDGREESMQLFLREPVLGDERLYLFRVRLVVGTGEVYLPLREVALGAQALLSHLLAGFDDLPNIQRRAK